MSILLTTMTIFLPQSRIVSMNARSVSVNGRSADVTNSTRSARGTNSVVSRSCSRMIAFVPGVSTIWMSRSSSAGAVITRMPFGVDAVGRAVAVSQHLDLCRRRRDPFCEDRLAEQRVDERALPGVELADDDQQEQLVELADRRGERRLIG